MNQYDAALNAEGLEPAPAAGFEIAFLPWLGMNREMTAGPVAFSPLQVQAVQDPEVREYLDRYLPRYREVDGGPVELVVVARHEGVTGFRYHTANEQIDLIRATSVLALAMIAKAQILRTLHNNQRPAPNADSFQLIFQRFTARSDYVGVTAGRWTHTWPLDQVNFTRPWTAVAVHGDEDSHLLEAMGNLLRGRCEVRPELANRIWRSVEWFRLAHLDGAEQPDATKLMTMATAFESLLDLPDFDKQAEFANRIQGLVYDNHIRRDVRRRRSGRELDLSLAGCWAWDFYGIRSRLIHGEEVPGADFRIATGAPHLLAADLVFRECLLRQLFELVCFGAEIHESAGIMERAVADFPEGPEPFDPLEWAINNHLQFDRIHEALGWSERPAPPEAEQ
ncbi:MAG: hypothetical protein ACE5JF_11910 [Anaerolineales bacterium]